MDYYFKESLSTTAPLRVSVIMIVCFREMAFVFAQITPNTGLTYQKLLIYVDRTTTRISNLGNPKTGVSAQRTVVAKKGFKQGRQQRRRQRQKTMI